MHRTRSSRSFRLSAPLALAIAVIATSQLSANDTIITQRMVQANGSILAQPGLGSWGGEVSEGTSASWQNSHVLANEVAAFGTSSAVGLGASASTSVLHVVSITEWSEFVVQGHVAGYAESPAGLVAGDCSITLSSAGGVFFAATNPTEVPYYEQVQFNASGTLEPGTYTLSIESNSIGTGPLFGPGFASYGSFSVQLQIVPIGCGSADGSCLVPHATPGCDAAECCAVVCELDFFCCDVEWDALCAMGAQQCGIAPSNAACDSAAPIGHGDWISTISGSGSLELPPACAAGRFSSINAPTYYSFTATTTGPLALELGEESTFDAFLALFEGPCANQVLIGCDDDSSKSGALQPRLVFDAMKGQTYTLVIGTSGTTTGVARLSMQPVAARDPRCLADFNGDGLVGPSDLAVLLGTWGTDALSADLDQSGDVGASDLAILLGMWGPCR